MSQSLLHSVTLEAKDCVALNKSHLAMRAANKIFMRTLLAIGCNRPTFSFSSRGLAVRLSWKGIPRYLGQFAIPGNTRLKEVGHVIRNTVDVLCHAAYPLVLLIITDCYQTIALDFFL